MPQRPPPYLHLHSKSTRRHPLAMPVSEPAVRCGVMKLRSPASFSARRLNRDATPEGEAQSESSAPTPPRRGRIRAIAARTPVDRVLSLSVSDTPSKLTGGGGGGCAITVLGFVDFGVSGGGDDDGEVFGGSDGPLISPSSLEKYEVIKEKIISQLYENKEYNYECFGSVVGGDGVLWRIDV